MGLITVNLDLTPLQQLATIGDRVETAAKREAALLLAQTHAHVVEEASQRLHARRQAYVDALSFFEEDGVLVLNLDARAVWIEDGQEPFDMLPGLLGSEKAKIAEDGHRYLVVPFPQGGRPATASESQRRVAATLKDAMRGAGIPWGKIEKDEHGNARLGVLHNLKVDTPTKTKDGPGWGRGSVGQPMQGPTGIPLLKGAKVVQQRGPKGDVRRGVMTFRVASEEHAGGDRWQHPGNKPLRLLDEAAEWAKTQWEREVVPRLLEELAGQS